MILSTSFTLPKLNGEGNIIVGPKTSPSQLKFVGIDKALIFAYDNANDDVQMLCSNFVRYRKQLGDEKLNELQNELMEKRDKALNDIEDALRKERQRRQQVLWNKDNKMKHYYASMRSTAVRFVRKCDDNDLMLIKALVKNQITKRGL